MRFDGSYRRQVLLLKLLFSRLRIIDELLSLCNVVLLTLSYLRSNKNIGLSWQRYLDQPLDTRLSGLLWLNKLCSVLGCVSILEVALSIRVGHFFQVSDLRGIVWGWGCQRRWNWVRLCCWSCTDDSFLDWRGFRVWNWVRSWAF